MRTYSKPAVAIIALLIAPILRADLMQTDSPGYLLTLTENSSTSLTYTYTGSGGNSAFTILNTGTDTWTVQVATTGSGITFFDFTWDWTEPEEPNEVNEAYAGGPIGTHTSFSVESDESLLEYQGLLMTIIPNNAVTPTSVGSDNGIPIFLQFNDLAQGPEAGPGVADNGSTLALLALPLVGLVSLRRFRAPKLV